MIGTTEAESLLRAPIPWILVLVGCALQDPPLAEDPFGRSGC